MILIWIEIKRLQGAKIKGSSQMGDPWGDLNAPEATSEQQLPLFISKLIKTKNHIRMKYSQNHFNITFGSAYFISKNNAVKLAKLVKKEPRKAIFPWDLGLLFVQPIKVHWYCRILNFITVKVNLMHVIYKFSLKFMQKRRFPYS